MDFSLFLPCAAGHPFVFLSLEVCFLLLTPLTSACTVGVTQPVLALTFNGTLQRISVLPMRKSGVIQLVAAFILKQEQYSERGLLHLII